VQVAEVAGDAHVPDHGPAHERDDAIALVRGVQHLLNPVHVAGEAGHDDPLSRCGEDLPQHPADLPLADHEPRGLRIRGIRQQQVHALCAESMKGAEVGQPAVERQLVHLEVARVHHQAGAGPDRHAEGVGDGMVDGDELALEGP
jgi:hypothetical protein